LFSGLGSDILDDLAGSVHYDEGLKRARFRADVIVSKDY
jgi:hypothetical protein